MDWTPRLHRISTHRLGQGLLRRPEHHVIGLTWGPMSILWDGKFKRDAARYNRAG